MGQGNDDRNKTETYFKENSICDHDDDDDAGDKEKDEEADRMTERVYFKPHEGDAAWFGKDFGRRMGFSNNSKTIMFEEPQVAEQNVDREHDARAIQNDGIYIETEM